MANFVATSNRFLRSKSLILVVLGGMVLVGCGGETGIDPPPPPQDPVVASVAVDPDDVTLTVLGATQQFNAVAKDASGNTISSKTFTWMSSDPVVATVTSTGLATAVSNGEGRWCMAPDLGASWW